MVDDSQNLDNNSNTDKIIRLAWATFNSSFPGIDLPAAAATVTFTTSTDKRQDPITGETYSTVVNYSASATASNYDFITGSTTLEVQTFNFDVDGDGQVTAFGDGLMIMRHLMEAFPGQALIDKAIGSKSPYYPSNWQAVATNIENLMVG